MFEHQGRPSMGRNRHRDIRGDIGRQLREELRRNLQHRGGGRAQPNLRDIFNQARQGGPSVRRGEIRPLILAVLRQKPMHGYEVIQELESQSGGRWRPSAGSVYPTLQQLADEGLVTSTEVDGRRTYTLTDEGQKLAASTGTRSPWTDDESDGDQQHDVMRLAMQLAGAVVQVQKLGSPRARSEAAKILTDARKRMYRLLAEDEDAATDELDTDDVDSQGGPA